MIAIDTNLLAYALRTGSAEHARALEALDQARAAPAGWGVPYPVLAEFWRLATGLSTAARPASPAEAERFLLSLWQAGAQVWFPSAGWERSLPEMAVRLGAVGIHVFDLQIALIARENGARELWTHDAGFLTVPGLRLRDPLGP